VWETIKYDTDCCDDGGGEEDALDVGPLVADLLRRDVHPLLGGHGDRLLVTEQSIVDFRYHLVLIFERKYMRGFKCFNTQNTFTNDTNYVTYHLGGGEGSDQCLMGKRV